MAKNSPLLPSTGSLWEQLKATASTALVPDTNKAQIPETDEEWVRYFEELGQHGFFASEPDFPKALAFYRDAVERQKDHPDRRDQQGTHRQGWRSWENHPDVFEGFSWVGEMHHRICNGIPPVIEAEFQELADWFRANQGQLTPLPEDPLTFGDDDLFRRSLSFVNLKWGLSDGPRETDAGIAAEYVRRLRARCTSPFTAPPPASVPELTPPPLPPEVKQDPSVPLEEGGRPSPAPRKDGGAPEGKEAKPVPTTFRFQEPRILDVPERMWKPLRGW